MNRRTPFAVDEYYHLYNRGGDKRDIFLSSRDYDRFIKLLYLCNSTRPITVRDIPTKIIYDFDRLETIVDIGAYCLMPNHFHLLIRVKTDGGVSLFMKKVATGYSMYFNIKHRRTGRLFENVYKASHVDSDEYLKYLFAYIHLNPLKLLDRNWREKGLRKIGRAKNYLLDYKYSSYHDYLNKRRHQETILNRDSFPGYFKDSASFEEYLDDWLEFSTPENTPEDRPLG